jgi:hypothetical protein
MLLAIRICAHQDQQALPGIGLIIEPDIGVDSVDPDGDKLLPVEIPFAAGLVLVRPLHVVLVRPLHFEAHSVEFLLDLAFCSECLFHF